MKLFQANPNSSLKYNCGYYLGFFIFTAAEAATCFVFYFLYPDLKCTNSNILPIQDWLLGSAIYLSILLILKLSIFGDKYSLFAVIHDTTLILELFFNIIWSVLGSFILFRDSMNCLETNGAIWIFTLFTLVFYWINILLLIWTLIVKIVK
jgi:hypothetical protein